MPEPAPQASAIRLQSLSGNKRSPPLLPNSFSAVTVIRFLVACFFNTDLTNYTNERTLTLFYLTHVLLSTSKEEVLAKSPLTISISTLENAVLAMPLTYAGEIAVL